MSPLDLAWHLLSFLAPALAVAVLVASASRLVLPRSGRAQRWWAPVALNFIAGVATLVAGLWLFGRDGKVATYAALVLAVATCQWFTGRAWRS